jgi:hypothetical protein
MVRSTGFAPARVAPGASQASLSTGSSTTALKWSQHRDVRPALSLTKTLRRSLRFVGKMGDTPGTTGDRPFFPAHQAVDRGGDARQGFRQDIYCEGPILRHKRVPHAIFDMISFKHWFRTEPVSHTDGLTQAQREAIVDLLNYCSFVDRDISDSEEVVIDSLETQLDWDHNQSFDYYVDKSIAAARKALESKDEEFFLLQIKARLSSPKSRETAIALSEKLIKADGRNTANEAAVLAAIRKTLG